MDYEKRIPHRNEFPNNAIFLSATTHLIVTVGYNAGQLRLPSALKYIKAYPPWPYCGLPNPFSGIRIFRFRHLVGMKSGASPKESQSAV